MNISTPGRDNDDREADAIDLFVVVHTLWRGRNAILVWAAAFLVLSVVYLHVAKRTYTASMTVIAAQNYSGASQLTSKLGGLASLAGIQLPKREAQSPFEAYMMRINTPETAAAMLKRKDIASKVFPNGWNAKAQTWEPTTSIVRGVISPIKWVLTGRGSHWAPPDTKDMETYIKANVGVNPDKETGAVTLSLSDKDPAFAKAFLWALHQELDSSIRAKSQRESAEYIAYISDRLKNVTIAEQHEALAQLLSQEEKQSILAGSGLPYAADVFSAPYSPPAPTSPKAGLTLFLGLILGGIFGAIYALLASRFEFLRFGGRLSGRWAAISFSRGRRGDRRADEPSIFH